MQLWTKEHAITVLPSLAVGILLTILLRALIGKKSLRIRMIPVQIVAVLLVLLEIGKQAVSFKNGYDLYHIPLHFCSIFLFALPAMAFYRGKYEHKVRTITATVCMSLMGLMLIFPNIIYGSWNVVGFFKNYFDFHTVAFHNLVMCAFVMIMGLNLYAPEEDGEKKAILLFVIGYCIIAASAAHLLKVNFANFYSSNVAPLDAIRISLQGVLGKVFTQILYVLFNSGLHIGFVWACYQLLRVVRKRLSKAETTVA